MYKEELTKVKINFYAFPFTKGTSTLKMKAKQEDVAKIVTKVEAHFKKQKEDIRKN
jgi:hypothetical protein